MENTNVAKERTYFRCSSSIENFREKLRKRTKLPEYHFNLFSKVIFFGCYHIGDYLRIILHRGKKKIFWCGSDILNLGLFSGTIISLLDVRHYCENEVERLELLHRHGIEAEIRPMIFDDVALKPQYKHSDNPHVYLSAHKGRRAEYGVELIEGLAWTLPEITFHIYGITGTNKPNIIYHGRVSTTDFDKQITRYHAALRLNSFDGFGEVLAKSILLGQYPISFIQYTYIDYAKNILELLALLRDLKNKKEPNKKARDYWTRTLEHNLHEITNRW